MGQYFGHKGRNIFCEINGILFCDQYEAQCGGIQCASIGILTPSQEFTLAICHGFDHIFPIAGIEKKLSTFRI
jgi:hypothetical protein